MKLLKAFADEILYYSKEAAPLEACGVIFGTSIRSIKNLSEVEGYYEMDPEEQLAVWVEAAALGEAITIAWHSHPTQPAVPSPIDIELAFDTEVIYVICSPARTGSEQLRAWRIIEGVTTEVPITLED